MGIPPDKLETIFGMFEQIHGSDEHALGGLGIGLTLVRRLVDLHGGSVSVASAGLGRGSEFTVRLPLLVGASSSPTTASGAGQPPSHLKVLIVDDNRDSADSLATLLNLTGNHTMTAYDGLEGEATMGSFRPDVALLDIGLPKVSGYELARRIRSQPWGKDVLLIALTGWGQDQDRHKSKEAGFDHHLVKPVDFNALSELLNERAIGDVG
jgi:CheY-like chemotaxis protein